MGKMNLRVFGIGTNKALTCAQVEGTVPKVNAIYWLKVNTKTARTSASDGAAYPHIICFDYCVDGKTYSGKRFVQWNKRCPCKDEKITVYYEKENPAKYAVIV